jgi:DNA (cytosine-5)-methyltransferase 1
MEKIKVFSFFSGLGLLDLGFENAGFKIEFINERNSRFLQAYRYARKDRKYTPEYGYSNSDIKEFLDDGVWLNRFEKYNSDKTIIGFIGGPPCPDFSVAGKNAGFNGVNGQLTSIYVQLVCKRKPDFFVLENVKGLYKTKKHRLYYDSILKRLRVDYVVSDSVENALEYGTPQNRDRLFVVGFRRNRYGNNIKFTFGHSKQFDMKDIMQRNWPKTDDYIENRDLPLPTGIIKELTVQYWFDLNAVFSHPNSGDVFKVKNRQRYETIPEGFTGSKSFKRLHRWRYSPTAAYGNNEVHLHPYLPRRLSVAEALAIQSVPKEVALPSDLPLSLKFKMVGNGVPYLLALGIGKDIYDFLCRIES